MTDTQSATTESQTTIDDSRARSRRSFIAVLKANRDVFSNLPEKIEQWLERETRATNQLGTTEQGRDGSDRFARPEIEKQLEYFQAEINANTQSVTSLDQTVREMTAAIEAMKSEYSSTTSRRDRSVERELMKKVDEIEANKEQIKLMEEEISNLKELKKKEMEAKEKIKEQEESIATLNQTVREMTAAMEAMKNEHSTLMSTRDRSVEREMKKKDDAIEANKKQLKLVEEENVKLKELNNEEIETKEKIKEQQERLESELEKKERQMEEIEREEKEKIEGLKNEHKKEVDKLSREIQTMKEKLLKKGDYIQEMYDDYNKNLTDHKSRNDTLLKELEKKEEEITEYAQRISHLKDEMKRNEESFEKIVTSLERQPTSKQTVSTMTEVTSIENQPISKQTVSTMTESEGQEDSERLKKMEGEFKATILERDEELKELKQSFDQMDEQYQSIISEKDEELNKSNYSFHQMKESLDKEIHTKHEELNQVKLRFHDMKEKAKSIISARNEELNQLKCRQNEQKEKFKALWESKDQELREVKMRLAHLSENLMKKDQRKVENTVAANRPSEVENDFKEFFDNERMDAIDKMQQVYGSEEESDIGISYPRLACIILEAAYEQTIEVKESALHVFKEIINIMIEEAPEQGQKYLSVEKNKQLSYRVNFKMPTCRQEMKYPTEVVDALVLSLKETAHLCSLESLEEGVRKKITDKWVSWLTEEKSCKFSFSHRMLFQLKDYIQACIRITWRMIIQVPPMQLEYKSTTLKNLHKKVGYHNVPEVCSRPPSNGQASVVDEIACYLWPALLDGGGRIIQAGEVLCKVEAQAK